MKAEFDLISWPEAEIVTATVRSGTEADINISVVVAKNSIDGVTLLITPNVAYRLAASLVETLGGTLVWPNMQESEAATA